MIYTSNHNMSYDMIIRYTCVCILYCIMQITMGTIMDLSQTLFNYSSLYITYFYLNIFFPITLVQYMYCYDIENIFKLKRTHFNQISFPAIVNIIEFVMTYWALQYVPISFYIIGRTSTAFVNVIFSKLYLKKHISIYYYIGLVLLLSAYVLIIMGYTSINLNNNEILGMLCVFASSLTTSIYNNMVEKFFDNFNPLVEEISIKEMKMLYQLIFNMYGFMLVMPIGLIMSCYTNQFTSDILPNILYSLTGIFYQINISVKIYILSAPFCSGNQIMTGLDLFRRVITNVIAYLYFDDYYNALIISSNVCILVGSFFIALGVFIKN